MMRRLAVAIASVLVLATAARADEPTESRPCGTACFVAKAREKLAQNDVEGARAELLAAYKLSPEPPLLFALGQVELKLGRCREAIEYYERYIATNPGTEQVSLAEQAIGAARMCLAQPAQPPQLPAPGGGLQLVTTPQRHWDVEDTGIVVLGGVAVVAGAGLAYYGRRLTQDASGTIADYDDRLHQAQISRWIGAGVAAVGAIAIGAALVRWRLSARTEIAATANRTTTAITVGRRW
jgi:tetratricopeptide (TPR) repeat protein